MDYWTGATNTVECITASLPLPGSRVEASADSFVAECHHIFRILLSHVRGASG